jgi:hypothetical protein
MRQRLDNELLIQTYASMRGSLDALKDETVQEINFDKTVVGSTIAVSTGVSVGYVIWLIRSGMLLTSMLASMPAWQIADPMPILTQLKDNEDNDDDDSLESILKKGAQRVDKKKNGRKDEATELS